MTMVMTNYHNNAHNSRMNKVIGDDEQKQVK